jgi:histidine kinase/DNA gyrase B/HSP90-like ATPase
MGLSETSAPRLAWGSPVVSVALSVAGFVVFTMAGPASPHAPESLGLDAGSVGENLLGIVLPVAFSIVGALVAVRRPDNIVGWLLCGVGLVSGLDAIISAYGYWGIIYHPGSLPGGDVALWVGQVNWLPSIPLGTSLFFLLFADGTLPSSRWRPVLWLTIAGAILGALGAGVLPTIYAVESLPNPVYAAPAPIGDWLIGVGFIALMVGLVASAVRLVQADGALRFEVIDDGRGFDPTLTGYGTGLQGMADRLAVVGGEIIVRSEPGRGTTIEGWISTGGGVSQ